MCYKESVIWDVHTDGHNLTAEVLLCLKLT